VVQRLAGSGATVRNSTPLSLADAAIALLGRTEEP